MTPAIEAGSADTKITMDLESAKIPHEMIAYSGAPHAFTVFDSRRYREGADRKSWQQFGQFLKQVSN